MTMKKLLFFTFCSFATLTYAQSFSRSLLVGQWEISSVKPNGFVSFGVDISTSRGDSYTLLFNKTGEVKNETTGEVYNYELQGGNLKIYKTCTYSHGNKFKEKYRYDLLRITQRYEGCLLVKIVRKKMVGYNDKKGYKWCKVEEYPQPVYTSPVQKYRF